MRHRPIRLGLVVATALATTLPLVAQTAYADYAPSKGDIVGVGSDTLQYGLDFLGDGDAYGDPGYNSAGNKYKLVDFDGTADSNGRQAYGVNGGQVSQTSCTPGTGSTSGTGNATGNNTGIPCVLNPTIVLRAGLQPVQRPTSSGGGIKALEGDINNKTENINFSRAAGPQTPSSSFGLDSVQIGTDTLGVLTATTTNATQLTLAQLDNIYNANTTGTNAYGGTGCVTWNEVGGASTAAIIPLIPPSGSGIRNQFLEDIEGVTSTSQITIGTCPVVAEQNDPTAIAQQGTTGAPNAIEPISDARLDLYFGQVENSGGGGTSSGGIGGYFLDPSCAYDVGTAACGSGSLGTNWKPNYINPSVQLLTSFSEPLTLLLYFRNSDVTSTTPFQPGTSENWVNALFYDPCPNGATNCTTIGGVTYGPDGAPYIDTSAGQQDLLDAGDVPVNTDAPGSFDGGGA